MSISAPKSMCLDLSLLIYLTYNLSILNFLFVKFPVVWYLHSITCVLFLGRDQEYSTMEYFVLDHSTCTPSSSGCFLYKVSF